MSLSFKVGGVVGGPLDNSVLDQLKQRKEIVSRRTSRSSDDIVYLNSNTGWVKVTSGVDIPNDGGSAKAKEFTLFNGVAGATEGFNPNSPNSSYRESETFGFTPKPGITDFSVKSRGTFGTLRDITFSFTAHSPEDFSVLEQLYLRPGYTVLIEWGHSIILDDQGRVSTNVQYFNKEAFLSSLKADDIQTRINNLKKANFNNYDALYGFIKNFSWTYNGYSYDCLVEVVSKGEVITSIRAAFSGELDSKDESDNVEYSAKQFGNGLFSVLSAIKVAKAENFFIKKGKGTGLPEEIILASLSLATPFYRSALTNFRVIIGSLGGDARTNEAKWMKYIPLRNFLELVNRGSLLSDQDKDNIVQFYTGGSKPTQFTTFREHLALDPYVCVLPKTSYDDELVIPLSKQVQDLEQDNILNIFVSVDYLLECLDTVRKATDTLDNTIYNFIELVMKGIEKNLGNINDFGINYEEEESLFYIVDRGVIPSKNDFEREGNIPKSYIDLVGLKSEVENLSISSKLSERLTTMIAIAAQASSNPSGAYGTLNVQKWNAGLVDRHLLVKNIGITQEPVEQDQEAVEKYRNKVKKFKDFIKGIKVDNNYYVGYDKENFDSYQEIHSELMGEYVRDITEREGLNNPGLIPFELSFTMKGISGIKIGQAFKINEFFLPDKYKGKVGFIVTGIDHNVSNGRWTTSFKTQITVL